MATETEPQATATASSESTATPEVATPNRAEVAASESKPQTLEDLLADLDDDRRKVILDQVSKPRNEAKNLRERLKALEPKAAEYDKLAEASKTELEKAQEAASRLAPLEPENLRLRVALEKGVPADLVDRLRGTTKEELEADAAFILDKFGAGTTTGGTVPDVVVPRPNPAQGTGINGSVNAAQLGEQDVKRLYAEKKYDEIEKARQEGRLDNLLGAN